MQFYVVSTTSKYFHQLPTHRTPSIQPLIQEITFHSNKDCRQYYSSLYILVSVFSWKMGMSSSTIKIYQDCRGIYCLQPQGKRPEDGNRRFHYNSKFLTCHLVSHPLKQYSSYLHCENLQLHVRHSLFTLQDGLSFSAQMTRVWQFKQLKTLL
jgi:hypothetical protein